MRIWVTRPAQEATAWVLGLQAAGLAPESIPLIEIGPVPDLAPAAAAWRQLGDYHAVMFVSRNAVGGFFSARPLGLAGAFQDLKSITPPTRAWATGPGTCKALLEAGVDASLIDAPAPDAAQFDSEALWQQVHMTLKAGMKVLVVRGEATSSASSAPNLATAYVHIAKSSQGVGRDWLGERLQAAGVGVDWVAVYQRRRPQFTALQRSSIVASAQDGSVWLFSSSEAIDNLVGSFTQVSWDHARAVATHARIAQTAQKAGFGVVYESRPTLEAVVASIESMR